MKRSLSQGIPAFSNASAYPVVTTWLFAYTTSVSSMLFNAGLNDISLVILGFSIVVVTVAFFVLGISASFIFGLLL